MIAEGQDSGKPCRKLHSRNSLQVCSFTLILCIWFQHSQVKWTKPDSPTSCNKFNPFSPPASCYKQAEMLYRADTLLLFYGRCCALEWKEDWQRFLASTEMKARELILCSSLVVFLEF